MRWNRLPQQLFRPLHALGAGAIYPVPESDIVVADFAIPDHWPRAFGLDVAWNRTAAIWGALNRETDTLYLYSEHYRGEAEPSVHAHAIKTRGAWICGAIDPAARGWSPVDGRRRARGTWRGHGECALRHVAGAPMTEFSREPVCRAGAATPGSGARQKGMPAPLGRVRR